MVDEDRRIGEFDKLVRDRTPEIVREDGCEPRVEVAEGDELREYLLDKIVEEAEEVREDPSIGELADVYEVLVAISLLVLDPQASPYKIRRRAKEKREEQGGFAKGYILKEVVDPEGVE